MAIPSTAAYRITALRPLLRPYVGPQEPLQPGTPLPPKRERDEIGHVIAGILPDGDTLDAEVVPYDVIVQDLPDQGVYNAIVRAYDRDGTSRDYLARLEEAHVWAEVYGSVRVISGMYGPPVWAHDSPGHDGLAYPHEPMGAAMVVYVPRGAPLDDVIAATRRAAAHLPWPTGNGE